MFDYLYHLNTLQIMNKNQSSHANDCFFIQIAEAALTPLQHAGRIGVVQSQAPKAAGHPACLGLAAHSA
jgi:hypothetical protein